MKHVARGLLFGAILLLNACTTVPPEKWKILVTHLPPKYELLDCTNSACDNIPLNISVSGKVCTVNFNYFNVKVPSGSDLRLSLSKLQSQSQYQFRFTNQPPGIAIKYGTDAPVFTVAYGTDQSQYVASALRDIPSSQQGTPYPFNINTEWYDGTKWSPCAELDPFIQNN